MPSAAWRRLAPLPLALTLAALAALPSPPPPEREPPGRALRRRAVAAVAWVHAAGQGRGTGWLLDRDRRLLVTCCHVVGDNDTVEAVFPEPAGGSVIAERAWYLENLPRLRAAGRAVRGRVLRAEPETDLALVRLESLPPGVAALPLAAESARPGQRVVAVGDRYDCPSLWVHAAGTVRQSRTLRDGYANGGRTLARGARVVEADVPVNEGDSGGPLLNERGEVVGVAAAVAWEYHGAGLFVDVAEVRGLLGRSGEAAPPPGEPLPVAPPTGEPPRDLYRRALRSFALLRPPESRRRGSGFVLDRRRRLLLASADLLAGQKTVDVCFPVWRDGQPVVEASYYQERAAALRGEGRLVAGVVLAVDERRTLALVEVPSLPDDVTEAGRGETPEPGDAVFSLGNPERSESLWMYCGGCVRQRGRADLGHRGDGPEPEVVFVQAPLSEGEAGGPLLDGRGRLVGVVSGKAGPQQLMSYAVALREVDDLLAGTRALWQPHTAPERCARGRLFAEARLYREAVAEYDRALEINPGDATACCERAGALRRLGRPEQAVADCTRALKLDDRLASAYAQRAAARCDLGRPDDALADAEAAVRLAPEDAAARAVRVRVRRLRGDVPGALDDAAEAVRLGPKVPEAYLERGLTRLAVGHAADAVSDLDFALVLDPRLPGGHRGRGDAHWARADVRAALADYEQALALDPDDVAARLGRGRARLARKEYDAGLADLDAVARQPGAPPELFTVRGDERLRRGDLDGALADFAEGLRRKPAGAAEVAGSVRRRADALDAAGRPADAADLRLRVLPLLRPALAGKATLLRAVDEALPAAAQEPDAVKRSERLRRVLEAVCDALSGG